MRNENLLQKEDSYNGLALVIPISKELANKKPFFYIEDTEFGHYSMMLYLIIKSQKLKNIVEIGVNAGYSTGFLLRAVKDNGGKLYSIDLLDKSDLTFPIEFKKHWKFIHENSITIGSNWKEPMIDLLFIDGDHSFVGAFGDLTVWYQHVVKGGYIAMHDCEPDSEVEHAMNQFFKDKRIEKIVFPLKHLELAIIKKMED